MSRECSCFGKYTCEICDPVAHDKWQAEKKFFQKHGPEIKRQAEAETEEWMKKLCPFLEQAAKDFELRMIAALEAALKKTPGVTVTVNVSDGPVVYAEAGFVPEAICLAALRAVGAAPTEGVKAVGHE